MDVVYMAAIEEGLICDKVSMRHGLQNSTFRVTWVFNRQSCRPATEKGEYIPPMHQPPRPRYLQISSLASTPLYF